MLSMRFVPDGNDIDTLRCRQQDRKSTRLNSSHDQISYAVFCLKKKKQSPFIAPQKHINPRNCILISLSHVNSSRRTTKLLGSTEYCLRSVGSRCRVDDTRGRVL